jgi:hypothetical protein
VVSKRAVLVVIAICCCALAGCFEWQEDAQGNLQSVGLPGVPVWKSKKPPAPLSPTDMGFTPEEASKMGGPVMVQPPDQSFKGYRYKYYPAGSNNCQEDLQKLLAQRLASNATGDPPYCTQNPTAPTAKGNAFVF